MATQLAQSCGVWGFSHRVRLQDSGSSRSSVGMSDIGQPFLQSRRPCPRHALESKVHRIGGCDGWCHGW